MLHIRHAVPREDVLLGFVRAENVAMDRYPKRFDQDLEHVLRRRSEGLGEVEETRRAATRDMLRNGSYKPTGRGKPASEYLLRAASEAQYTFPRINSPVDICNFMSLEHVVPISLWDLDLAAARSYVFRRGAAGEGYVFNAGGQRIDVVDLLVGCRVQGTDAAGEPIINPVRDSMATKTTDRTTRVAACIYAPSAAFTEASLGEVCRAFAERLRACGHRVEVAFGVAAPDSSIDV